jgi:hypothetical protein
MRQFLIGTFLTIVGIAALILIPSQQDPAPMPWEANIMSDGQVRVFDIHLGQTTLIQAQQTFKTAADIAIFHQAGKQATIEAFFESINLGGLSAKIVLNLSLENQAIETMMNRAVEAKLQPSGARKYALYQEDNIQLLQSKINSITYIPSVRLDEEMVLTRFGPAGIISSSEEGGSQNITTWTYPNIGLTILFNPEAKTILEYSLKK